MNLQDAIAAAAKQYNLDPALVSAVVQQESRGNPGAHNASGGGSGAWGAMQVRGPALQDFNAANGTSYQPKDLLDPAKGVQVGAWYLDQQLSKFGNPAQALVAYNEGAGSPTVGKGSSPYAQQVLSRLQSQQAAPAQSNLLPGIPGAPAGGQLSGDDALRLMTKGPATSAAAPGQLSGDDALRLMTKPIGNPAAGGTPLTNSQYDPTEDMWWGQKFLAGMGKGFVDTYDTYTGAKQLGAQALNAVSPSIVSDQTVKRIQQDIQSRAQTDAPLMNTGMGVLGNVAGLTASMLPLMYAAPASVGAGLWRLATTGAGLGAASGALAPVEGDNYWAQKAAQVGLGAAAGGITSPLVAGLGRMISPNVSPEVRTMLNAGVTPTPGQIIGGGAARAEEKLTSLPVVGDMIKNAQARGVQQFNRATYQNALSPLGATLPDEIPTGSQAIGYVQRRIGQAYTDLEPKASFVEDQNFMNDLTQIRAELAQNSPASVAQFDNIVQHQVSSKLDKYGVMNGQQWGNTRSAINKIARERMIGNASPDDRMLSNALGDLNDAVNDAVGRSSPPEVLPQLQQANAAWAQYKQIEKAAGTAGAANQGNIFSPAQFNAAVRAGSTAAQKAQNSGLNAGFGNAAQNVLGSKYPDSGTAGRALMSMLASGAVGGGMATNPAATLGAVGATGLASLPYTQLGQGLAAKLLTSRPAIAAPIGQGLGRLGPLGLPVVAPQLMLSK